MNVWNKKEPIAIVGIGCRFPGASTPQEFWKLLCEGKDVITDFPKETGRFDVDAYYDAKPATRGKMVARQGGFLANIDRFDYSFFGISAREAPYLDPQIRVLLEVAWEALEDAGEIPEQYAGSQTGVFMGAAYNDYLDVQARDLSTLTIYPLTDAIRSMIAGRLSFALDLRGPSLVVDTACSSSLVAVHLACQSLWSGESTQALAGGVSIYLQPHFYVGFSQANMLSPESRCKAFDANANGFVRSEGAAIVLLKPLSRAIADCNPLYAVICGSAISHDGQSDPFLLKPSQVGQEMVLRKAYACAGRDPRQVDYVETHGTGTQAGDPVEVAGLAAVLGTGRSLEEICYLGSVKTNIGHTESASGMAGLIKTALCLKYRLLPPNLHFQTPSPAIPWHELPFKVVDRLLPWPQHGRPALAGVSSFGLSATNAHIVIEEAPRPVSSLFDEGELTQRSQLLPLSAHSEVALREHARRWHAFLSQSKEVLPSLGDLCYTAAVRRTHHAHRLAVVGSTTAALAEQLEAFCQEEHPSESVAREESAGRPEVVFVFPGQGSQWLGMGQRLLEEEPVFLESMQACEQAMRPYVDWSLLEQLRAGEGQSRLHEISCVQPVLFAFEVSLARLWMSFGLCPDAVVGHSMGEVAAAHIAGILSLEDAVRIICLRSRLLRRVSGQGAMAVVGLSGEQAKELIHGREAEVSVAVCNSPHSTVLSGDLRELEDLRTHLEDQGIFFRLVKVDVASHSPQMDALREDLLASLDGIAPTEATLTMYSTVTAKRLQGPECRAGYWVCNLRQPVLFASVVAQILEQSRPLFLEISPHPLLLSAIGQCASLQQKRVLALPSLSRWEDERAVMLTTLGTCYQAGLPVAWERLFSEDHHCVALPTYPWQREYCWSAPALDKKTERTGVSARRARRDGHTAHPLLQDYHALATAPHLHFWTAVLDVEEFPYLREHRVGDVLVFPAAGYIEMACAAAEEAFSLDQVHLSQFRFEQALFLPEDHPHYLQVVINARTLDTVEIQFLTPPDGEGQEALCHARGVIHLQAPGWHDESVEQPVDLATVAQRCERELTKQQHYQAMQQRDLQYGPCFQGVEQVWCGQGEALARVQSVPQGAGQEGLLPATLLDACLQVAVEAMTSFNKEETYLPVGFQTFAFLRAPDKEFWVSAQMQPSQGDKTPTLTLLLLNDAGEICAQAEGLRLQRVETALRSRRKESKGPAFYELVWEPRPRAPRLAHMAASDSSASWLILADTGGVGIQLQAALEEAGADCILVQKGSTFQRQSPQQYQLVPDQDMSLLFQSLADRAWKLRGIIHLWALDTPASEHLDEVLLLQALKHTCGSTLHLVQHLAHHQAVPLFLVTRGAQAVSEQEKPLSSAQAALWGLGRVIALEHPKLLPTLIDLPPQAEEGEVSTLYRELVRERENEEQIALRGAVAYVAHLRQAETEMTEERGWQTAESDTAFHLAVKTPGTLEDLHLRACSRPDPAPGEVEIQVEAAGLNFRDVLLAQGIQVGQTSESARLGWECAGVIRRVGPGVAHFQVGDAVVAFSPTDFRSFALVPAPFVVQKPAELSFEEAASLPMVFFTAAYALFHLAHLQPGERVLIHSAAGGVGLAAVQLAQMRGADIFATAGTEEKRAYLRSLGVQHVMDSRRLTFLEEVRAKTDGRGIDVVLNSLSGEALRQSIEALAPFGRFVEIGKRDIFNDSQIGLWPFEKNLSFSVLALDRILTERPEVITDLLEQVMQWVSERKIRPLPVTSFEINEAQAAFRFMATGAHMGKLVFSMRGKRIQVQAPKSQAPYITADATYLLTGGAGGVGLIIAEALVTQGAKHLVLASRNQPAVAAQEAFERLRKRGAQIEVMRADIGQREQVVHLLKTIERTMPPLRGVIHAAGVLDDATLLSLDWQRFERVLMPKALGAWHLHQLTKHLPLDLFVCFSSAMSLLGSPGQGNYCAANAFLDTLAHERRRLGLPALSINWGAWAQVGLAAAQANRGERLAERGLLSFSPEQGRAAWERLLQQQKPQLAYMVFDAHQWQLFYPHTRHWTLLAKLAASEMKREQGNTPSLREHLLETKGEERVATLETYVAGVVLKIVSGKQTKIRHDIPLARLGLDSLMALEMRTTMTRDLQCQIPLKEMLGSSSIQQIAQRLHQLLASGEEENKGEREPPKMGKMVMVSGSGERRETSGHGF